MRARKRCNMYTLRNIGRRVLFRERGTCDREFGAPCARVPTRIRIHALVSAVLKYAWASLSTFRRKLRRNNTRGLHSILLILSTPPPHYPQVLDTTRRSHLPVVVLLAERAPTYKIRMNVSRQQVCMETSET